MKTYVIAEIGSTHGGDLETAKQLIRDCARAGASACKFQYWSDPKRLAERRGAPELAEMYAVCQMPAEWLPALKAECQTAGVDFGCTGYLPEDLPTLAPHVDFWKIASFEAGDLAFIESHRLYQPRPTYISTGMLLPSEIGRLWARFPTNITLLHCTSGYPTPPKQVNLRQIGTLLRGFSDHTGDVLTGAFAVCRGAEVIEVHVRPEGCSPENPDYPHSLTPWALERYAGNIVAAEDMLGTSERKVQPCEVESVKYRVLEGAR